MGKSRIWLVFALSIRVVGEGKFDPFLAAASLSLL